MTTGRLRKEKGKEREEKKGNISQEECARSLRPGGNTRGQGDYHGLNEDGEGIIKWRDTGRVTG